MKPLHTFFSKIRCITFCLLALSLFTTTAAAQTEQEIAKSNILFNWAEKQYATFFSPSPAVTQSIQGYLARYYADTDTWLATMDDQVYVYGNLFNDFEPVGFAIKSVGKVNDYWSLVKNSSPLIISEIVAKAADGGNDWFELYVTGTAAVNLGDYSVVDDNKERAPVSLPAITLTPGQFLVIQATDEAPATGDYYVNFKLGASDSLSLFKNDELVDYLQWEDGEAPSGSSYGVLPTNLSEAQTLNPTPGATNEKNAEANEANNEISNNNEVIPELSTNNQAVELFDTNKVVDVYIEINATDWQAILADPMAEEYKPSTMIFNGIRVENVAFRTKGNSSLMSVARDKNSNRYSFKVDIDRYLPEQTLAGIRKLNFNNNWSDPSYMREYLSYDLMRYMGLPTPRIAYVNLYINNNLHGLYTVVESVDSEFLQQHFTQAAGDLYKPDGKGSDLLWISDNFDDYSGVELQTNEDSSDNAAFMTMIDMLNHGTDYQSVLNIDEILRYFAVSTVLSNLDSYQGSMTHNYYLYEENGVFSIIPWDFNLSFGSFNAGCSEAETIGLMIDEPTTAAMSNRPLIDKLLQDPNYRATYHSYFEELINGPFNPETMAQSINKIAALIRDFVYADPTAFYTPEEFEASLTEGINSTTESTVATTETVLNPTTDVNQPIPGESGDIQPPQGDFQPPQGDFQPGDFQPPQGGGDMGGMGSRFGLQSFVEQRVANIRGQLDGTIPSSGDGSGSCKAGSGSPGRNPPGELPDQPLENSN